MHYFDGRQTSGNRCCYRDWNDGRRGAQHFLGDGEEFEPLKVDLKQQQLLIEGVVVGVLRRGKTMGMA